MLHLLDQRLGTVPHHGVHCCLCLGGPSFQGGGQRRGSGVRATAHASALRLCSSSHTVRSTGTEDTSPSAATR